MRIIYFENDEIDARLFKRACRNLTKVEVIHYNSHLDLSDSYINSYDGVILDQFLEGCSIKEFAQRSITVPTAVLSATKEFSNDDYSAFIGIWQKPVQQDSIKKILELMKMKSVDSISMEYIDDLVGDSENDKKELLRDIGKHIEQHLIKLKHLKTIDKGTVLAVHNLKSKIGIFYLENLYEKLDLLEDTMRKTEKEKVQASEVEEIVVRVENVINQINNKLV